MFDDRTMRAAHQKMTITNEDFEAVTTVMRNTFEEVGISEEMIGEIMAIVNATRGDIVNA